MVYKNKNFQKKKKKKTLKKKHLKKGGSFLGQRLKSAAHTVTAPIENFGPKFLSDEIKLGECKMGKWDNSTIALAGLGAAACIGTAGAACVAGVGARTAGKELLKKGVKSSFKKGIRGKISNNLNDHSHASINKAKKQIDDCNKNGDKHMSRVSDSLGAWLEPDADPEKIQENLEYHQKKLLDHTVKRKNHLKKVQLERMKEEIEKNKPPDNPDYILFLIMYLLNQYKEHSLEHDLKLNESQQAEYKEALEKSKEKNMENTESRRNYRLKTKTLERKVMRDNRDRKDLESVTVKDKIKKALKNI